MAQTLDEFAIEARAKLDKFEQKWKADHLKDPEGYPLEMIDGNEGLWWECLIEF